ncbi:MAG: alpha-ketoglutarate-dependent dioxygenase AlkB [Planctomycetota bacterium]
MNDPIALFEPAWLEPQQADEFFTLLRRTIAWRQDQIHLFGRTHDLPRLQAWYGDPGTDYVYSGIAMKLEPWIPPLAELCDRLTATLGAAGGAPFNSVLCNLYRDGRDSNGWHSDDERALGPAPVVASISLGATRRFRLRPKRGPAAAIALDLPSGSLLVMRAGTQATWQHTLPKTARDVGERINLTFRRVLPAR